MENLQISKDVIRKRYESSDANQKKVLEDIFGKYVFSDGKIIDRIKTFEDACKELGIDSSSVIPEVATAGLQKDEKSIQAYCKLIIIAKALNEGWAPNWAMGDEYKWFPWFDLSSGSGLRYGDNDFWLSLSTVGSRLCYKTKELAIYAGQQFEDIYQDYFII